MEKITFWISVFILLVIANTGNAQTINERKKTVHQQLDEKRSTQEAMNFQKNLKNTAGDDFGPAPDWSWAKQFGGDGYDFGYDIATDGNGNTYIAGSFSGTITIGSIPYTSTGFVDMFLAKTDNDGTVLWWRQSSVAQYQICEALGIALDNANNVYVTGYFDAPSLIIGTNSLSRIGTVDLFVAKYDNDGNPLWARNTGVPNMSVRSKKIAVDGSGNSYIITTHDVLKYDTYGQFKWEQTYPTAWFFDVAARNANFYLTGYFITEVTFGSITLPGYSYNYFPFITKGTPEGYYNWAMKAESTTRYNRGDAIAVDADENVYFAGTYRRQLTFGSTVISSAISKYTPYVAKYNVNGEFQWVQSAFYSSGLSDSQKQTDLCLDPNDNPYIIGFHSDGCNFGDYNLTGNGYYIARYSSDGPLEWVKTQDYSMSDTKITLQGGIYQITSLNGNIVLQKSDLNVNQIWKLTSSGNSGLSAIAGLETDHSGNIYSLGSTTVVTDFTGNATGQFVAKHNSNRELQWIKQISGADGFPSDGDLLFLDESDNVYVAGTFSDTLEIENITMVPAGGPRNIFLAKYNGSGNFQWARQIKGTAYGNGAIVADHQGNVVVTSTFADSVMIGNTIFTDWGYGDIFLVKYNSSGDFLWAKHIGGTDTEYSSFVSVDGSNNIFLTGEFLSRQINFTGLSMTLNESDGDVILAKYSPDGIPQWAYDYGDGDSANYARLYCWPTTIETDASGNSYIYGWTGEKNYYGSFLLESPYGYNFFLTKINSTGQVLWAKIIKEKQYGWQSMQIDIDGNGNCYVGGNMRDTVYFENNMYVKQGLSDLFIAKYDQQGTFRWVKTVGSSKNMGTYAYLSGIAVYDSSSIYTGGRFTFNYNFDNILLSASGQNGFLSLLGDPVSAINENSLSSISVSPNPGDGTFYIKLGDNLKGPVTVAVYNSMGQIITNTALAYPEPVLKIDLTNYPKGIYLIKVQGTRCSGVEKIILR